MRRPPPPSTIPSPSQQLVALIRNSGLTPSALAVAAGVAPSMLSRFLNHERTLNLGTVDRLCQALGGVQLAPARKPRRLVTNSYKPAPENA